MKAHPAQRRDPKPTLVLKRQRARESETRGDRRPECDTCGQRIVGGSCRTCPS